MARCLRIWNVTTSPASLVNSIPIYCPDADDHSWDGLFWANDGTLVTRNPQGGFQFLSQDKAKGAILTATVGSGKHGLLQLGNKQFVDDNLAPGTLQIDDVAVAPNGRAFGALNGKRDKKPGFFTWLIPSATPVGFLAFELAGEPDLWECNGIAISQDGSQLAASLYYPGTVLPPMPKTWTVSIWHGSPPKKLDLQGDEKNLIDFRFRDFSPEGSRAATSGATCFQQSNGNILKHFVAIWDAPSGKKLWQFDDVFTNKVLFTRDGRTLVTGAADTSAGEDRTAGGAASLDMLDPTAPQTVDFGMWRRENGDASSKIRAFTSLAVSPDGSISLLLILDSRMVGPRENDKGTALRSLCRKEVRWLGRPPLPVNQDEFSDERLEREARERRQGFLNGVGGQKSSNGKE